MSNDLPAADRRRRRIALVGPSYPYRGGIAHFVDSVNEELVSRGHHTLVVSFRRQYPGLLFPGRSQFETSGAGEPDIEGVALRTIDSLNPVTWFKASRIIRRDRSEIAVLNHWTPFFAPAIGTIAHRLQADGIRSVLVAHNALPHERHVGDISLTRFVLGAADKVICLSADVGTQLRAQFEIESVVIPHPVYDRFGPAPDRSIARDSLKVPHDAHILLFFGFVRRYKGLDILIAALPQIVRTLPKALVVVAGEFYEDPTLYRKMVKDLGMEGHVRFEDMYIPGSLVPTYFAAADVVVQPYRSATQSGVAQIAFHYDCPVITTDRGGLSEIVDDGVNGIVVAAPEPHLIAEAVIRFFSTDMRTTLSAAIASARGDRSWSSLVDEIERT